MKRIVYIGKYNGIIGGIERYMQNSAALLRRNGFTVQYLYTEEGGKEREKFAAAFDAVQRFTPEHDSLKQADLIVLHNIISPAYLSGLPVHKTFFFAHDHNIYCQRHHYYTPFGRVNCSRKFHPLRCALCSLGRNSAPPLKSYCRFPAIVLSDYMAENLRKNGFVNVVKLPAFIRTAEKKHRFMQDGVLRLLFLGQLIRGKGADLMLNALAKLDIPFTCTIAGDGNDRIMLENMVEKWNLCDKVQFKGFVSEPEHLWDDCDVFVFPIRWQEPFGLVGLEAMAHGVPAVAFDLGGVREWLTDGVSGIAVPEHGDLCAALKRLYEQHKILLPEMGRAALRLAGEKFSEEMFTAKFKGLCEEMQK